MQNCFHFVILEHTQYAIESPNINAKCRMQNAKDKTIPPSLLKQIHLPLLKGGLKYFLVILERLKNAIESPNINAKCKMQNLKRK